MIFKCFGGPMDGREVEIESRIVDNLNIAFPIECENEVEMKVYRSRFKQAVYEQRDVGDIHFMGFK